MLASRDRSMPRSGISLRSWARLLVLLGVLSSLTFSRAHAQSFNISARTDLSTAAGPNSMAWADFNGDGKLDCAVTDFTAGLVTVLFGNGAGLYGNRADYTTGVSPNSVATGDVNGDGKIDLVIANLGSNTVSVLLNKGDGTFNTKVDLAAGIGPVAVTLADFNGDGKLDIAVTNNTANTVSVLLGNGVGGFGPKSDFATGNAPYGISTGDVTGDGKLDLLIANSAGNTVTVYSGNGSGGFTNRTDYATGTGPYSIGLMDLNADGRLDIATSNYTGNSISVLLANSSGTFNAKTDYALNAGNGPFGISLGDVNGDGKADIVTSNAISGAITVFLGANTGTFSSGTDYPVGGSLRNACLIDANSDGGMDIAAANFSRNQLTVLLGNPGGIGFSTIARSPSTTTGATLCDVNRDGRLDLISSYGQQFAVQLGDGAGHFSSPTLYDPIFGRANGYTIGDLNSDGKLDIVAMLYDRLVILFGNGDGTFAAPVTYPEPASNFGAELALGDLNGDGKTDIVAAQGSSDSTVAVFLNNNNTFGTRTTIKVGPSPASVALADFNGDGKLDIAVANSIYNFNNVNFTGSISILLGNGTGTFNTRTAYATDSYPNELKVGDVSLDGVSVDGKLDIVFSAMGTTASTGYVLPGNGNGTFGARIRFGPDSVKVLALSDINNDGKADLIIETNDKTVSLCTLSTGGYSSKKLFVAPLIGLAMGDINGDGTIDFVQNDFTSLFANDSLFVIPGCSRTRVDIASTPAFALPMTSYTFTANVVPLAAGFDPPTGTVSFFDGTTPLATVPVSAGTATYTTSNYQLVNHSIRAVYSGDSKCFGSSGTLQMSSVFAPRIASIRDVLADQGGKVRVAWNASPLDRTPNDPITQYWIWRQVPSAIAANRLASGAYRIGSASEAVGDARVLRASMQSGQAYFWEYVTSENSHANSGYSIVVPTASDSSAISNPKTIFMVEAEELSDGMYWSSAPDSGYSVDNLPPAPPLGFTASYSAGATRLAWWANGETDLGGYRLYRGSTVDFIADARSLVAALVATSYADAGAAGSYYKLSAVDVHGNESGYALVTPSSTLGVDDEHLPKVVALAAPSPNPAHQRAAIAFALPRAATVTLGVYDVNGRLVRTLATGGFAAGRHSADWNLRDAAGRPVAGGVYFARLETEGRTQTRRFAVIK